MVSLEDFLVSFPEFSDFEDHDLIRAKIAEATRRVNAEVWKNLTHDGIKYLAASLLANSPLAQQARLDAQNDIYISTYDRLAKSITPAAFVT